MKEIDTIREIIESSFEYVGPAGGFDIAIENIISSIAALSTVTDAQRNIKELRDLLDLQHTSTMEADKLWQKANGKDCLPDLGKLIEWLMKRSDPDAIRRECANIAGGAIVQACVDRGLPEGLSLHLWEIVESAILGTEPAREDDQDVYFEAAKRIEALCIEDDYELQLDHVADILRTIFSEPAREGS